jgi:hypothetical protein
MFFCAVCPAFCDAIGSAALSTDCCAAPTDMDELSRPRRCPCAKPSVRACFISGLSTAVMRLTSVSTRSSCGFHSTPPVADAE